MLSPKKTTNDVFGPRRSGRTTRMLQKVLEALVAGKLVALVAADRRQLMGMMNQLALPTGDNKLPGRLFGYVMNDPDWRIDEPDRIRHLNVDDVFVDHHVFEVEIQNLTHRFEEGLHRWDERPNDPIRVPAFSEVPR
jgi:hypothetical protein